MEPERKASLEKESQTIRAELKVWEHQWSREHRGSKPSRQEIKDCPEIAKKYKQYNKLRDILSGKLKDSAPKASERKVYHETSQTPVKKSKHSHSRTETQSSIPFAIDQTPTHDRTAPSPAAPTSIGPTPHRDGKVLGLFAFLDANNVERTPSKAKGGGVSAAENLLATPSKTPDIEDFKLGKTPLSVGKRRLLDSMLTPLKDRDGNTVALWGVKTTPKPVSKLQFGTPAFLRRRTLPAVDESGEYTSPQKLQPTKRRPFARGLSDLVANLRKVEEHAFDDEEEAMLEMEAEEMGVPTNPKPKLPLPTPAATAAESQSQFQSQAAFVPDSQVPKPALLGGFDDEAEYDSTPEEFLDRGRPMKEYKKKAPKRTTRKVNMRPTFVKRPVGDDGTGLAVLEDDDEDMVPETQLDGTVATVGDEEGDLNFDLTDDEDGGDEEYNEAETGKKRKRAGPKKKTDGKEKEKGSGKKSGDGEEKGGRVKKAVRKVNELAHANFKRLKLRNRGAKGGPGHNSRFRRRR